MKSKTVKSNNPLKSPEYLGNGVIQTINLNANEVTAKINAKEIVNCLWTHLTITDFHCLL